MDRKSSSLADQVYERLESDILYGRLLHGAVVTELQLCEALGVSRTPIREAIRRLEQEHLLEAVGKGSRILGITRQDYADMCAVRMRIEDLAVAGFIRCMSEASLAELRDAVELQEFYLSRINTEQLKQMDSRFHTVIYKHCGSGILRDTLMPLHNKVQKFRRLSIETPERAERSVREHREIYEAIAARDEALAGSLLVRHVHNAMENVLQNT